MCCIKGCVLKCKRLVMEVLENTEHMSSVTCSLFLWMYVYTEIQAVLWV